MNGMNGGAGTDNPPGVPESPYFSGFVLPDFKFFCVLFCKSLFSLFLLTIVMFVLLFTASVYHFGIFFDKS